MCDGWHPKSCLASAAVMKAGYAVAVPAEKVTRLNEYGADVWSASWTTCGGGSGGCERGWNWVGVHDRA